MLQRLHCIRDSIRSVKGSIKSKKNQSQKQRNGPSSQIKKNQSIQLKNGEIDPNLLNATLRRACRENNEKAVRASMVLNGNPNVENHDGWNAVHFAVAFGSINIVKILFSRDAQINTQTKEGWTPLMLATYYNQTSTVKFLLKKGADPNISNKYGSTALLRGTWNNSTESVITLLRYGKPDINQSDYSGRTVLHWASANGNYELISIFIHYGANIHCRDDGNRLPEAYAKQKSRKHISQFIYHVHAHHGVKIPKSPNLLIDTTQSPTSPSNQELAEQVASLKQLVQTMLTQSPSSSSTFTSDD